MNITLIAGASKRRNSTLRPSGGSSFSCVLKENTSVMEPAFLLTTVNWNWTYCVWDGRYYYVKDIVSETATIFRVECKLDVLATFKTQIGSYETLIARAASDQDYDVVDSIYPAKARPTTKRTAITAPGIFTTSRASGAYVVGTIGHYGQHFYLMSASYFQLFCQRLFPNITTMPFSDWVITELSQAPAGGLNTILQNIVLLKWLPVTFSTVSGLVTSVSTVYIGNWELTTPAYELQGDTAYRILSTGITFPDRDDAGARGRWLYQSPFASYSVYIPPFGLISAEGAYILSAGRQLTADIMVELLSGNVTLRLYYALGTGGVKMLGVYNSNVGLDLKAGGNDISAGTVAGGLIGALGYAMEDKTGSMVSSIASAVSGLGAQAAQIGGGVSGPVADIAENWYAYATYFDPIDENRAELGRPLAEVRTIGSLSGFVKCADPNIAIPGHAEEMTEINALLASGIFYE